MPIRRTRRPEFDIGRRLTPPFSPFAPELLSLVGFARKLAIGPVRRMASGEFRITKSRRPQCLSDPSGTCLCTDERREQAVAFEDSDIVEIPTDRFLTHLQ